MSSVSLLRWWAGGPIPKIHLFIPKEKRPSGIYPILRVYFRKWVVHPIKRRIARYWLRILQRFFGVKVIAITGSAGKTTTKEMLHSVLSRKYKVISTIANIDPVYNIPTTILKARPGTQILILEMGVEFPGEMDFYLWMGKPDIGIITNIYPTHTQFFGDIGGVFREKSKLVLSLDSKSLAILNREDNQLKKLLGKIKAKDIWFGNGTDVMSSQEKILSDGKTEFLLIFNQNPKEKVKITIPIPGKQFVENALAVSATAYNLGLGLDDIKTGLAKFDLPQHRMKIIKHKSGALIIDDSYNNNPSAAIEAIAVLDWIAGAKRKAVVFGDMLELGNLEKKYHVKLGTVIAKSRVHSLICVGNVSRYTGEAASEILGKSSVVYAKDWKKAIPEVKKHLRKDFVILIKGSRSLHMEFIVDALL